MKDSSSRRRRWVPPVWVLAITAGPILAGIGGRIADFSGDHAMGNMFLWLGIFLALAVLGIWFLLFSGYRLRTRLLALAALIVAGMAGSAVLKVEQVSGELVPSFTFRWAPAADELLTVPGTSLSGRRADLRRTTADDFPQFLGPNRDARFSAVRLRRDWGQNQPKCRWRRPIGAGWSSFVAVNGFAVTLEQRGEQELVTCYEVETGHPVWVNSLETRHATLAGGVGPRSTPTIHDGNVYALGASGVVRCLEGATGKVLWTDDLLTRYGVPPGEDEKGVAWGRAASPLIVDDLLVVPAGGPSGGPWVSLAAFHHETGKLAWEAGDRQVSYASPVLATLAGKRQILSVNENNISAHDPKTGKVLWSYDWPGKSTANPNVSQPALPGEDRVLLSKGYGGGALMLRVQPTAGGGLEAQVVWRTRRLLKTKFTNVVLHEGHIYGLSDGILECVDVDSGTRQWKAGRYGHGQLLGVGPLLLVQAESGEVAMVEAVPTGFTELGRFTAFAEKTWNNLCLYGRFLLARNSREAACFELPVERAAID